MNSRTIKTPNPIKSTWNWICAALNQIEWKSINVQNEPLVVGLVGILRETVWNRWTQVISLQTQGPPSLLPSLPPLPTLAYLVGSRDPLPYKSCRERVGAPISAIIGSGNSLPTHRREGEPRGRPGPKTLSVHFYPLRLVYARSDQTSFAQIWRNRTVLSPLIWWDNTERERERRWERNGVDICCLSDLVSVMISWQQLWICHDSHAHTGETCLNHFVSTEV